MTSDGLDVLGFGLILQELRRLTSAPLEFVYVFSIIYTHSVYILIILAPSSGSKKLRSYRKMALISGNKTLFYAYG